MNTFDKEMINIENDKNVIIRSTNNMSIMTVDRKLKKKVMVALFKQADYKTQLVLKNISPEYMQMFRDLPSQYIQDQYENNRDKVLAFIAHHSWRAEQGSDKWKKIRNYSVGASEMSTLQGKNKYCKLWQLAERKTGNSTFEGSEATRWGNVFEPVIEKITENKFGEIYYTGSIPGISSEYGLLQSASPDGLGVVPIDLLQQYLEDGSLLNPYELELPDQEDVKVLYEFKVPFKRFIKEEVPSNYIPQIKTGMNTCLCDLAIFGDCLMRICSYENFEEGLEHVYTSYNKDYHPLPSKIPILIGTVGIYESLVPGEYILSGNFFEDFQGIRFNKCFTVEETFDYLKSDYTIDCKSFMEAYINLNDDSKLFKLNDYGSFYDYDQIHEVFKTTTETKRAWYSQLVGYNSETAKVNLKSQTNEFIQWCCENKKRPLGIFYYKVFDVKFILVENDPNYVENLRPLLEDFQTKIIKISNSPNPTSCRAELFPIPKAREYKPRKKKPVKKNIKKNQLIIRKKSEKK